MTETLKKRGRPAKKQDPQTQVVEVIREVIKTIEVEKPILEDFDLYKALKDTGFVQGGMGQWMEDPNGAEKVYIPHPQEITTAFIGDPEMWNKLRDGIIRAYLDVYGEDNR